MDNFTFIIITYNHERYIIDHLESIKTIIDKYRDELSIDILISDDASTDETIKLASKWIDENNSLFRNKILIQRKNNVGTVRNIFDAVNQCKTENFKLLAGDDRYADINIFEIQKKVSDNEVVITPLIAFAEAIDHSTKSRAKWTEESFNLIYQNKKKLKKLEQINNYIPAPGAFYGKNVLRDRELQQFVSNYRLIEDVPIWHFILFKSDKYQIRIIDSPRCIYYRLNSGISVTKKEEKLSEYQNELNKIRKDFDLRFFKYPKWINPYCYEIHLIRLISVFKKWLTSRLVKLIKQ